jgi:hypothetical protein
MKRPASPAAKAIVAGVVAVLGVAGVIVAPADVEPFVLGALVLLELVGVYRVPNEEPEPVIEELEGEPAEGNVATLGGGRRG